MIVTSEYELLKIQPPALPFATPVYDEQYQNQLNNVLRLYFNRLQDIVNRLNVSDAADPSFIDLPYGAFHDNTTQTAASANVAYAVTFDSEDYSNQIARGTPTSRIVVSKAGLYNFQFSAQLDKASGSAANIWFWPKVNGVNVTASAGKVAIQGTTAESVPSWNYLIDMAADDYFQLYWMTDDTDVQLKYEAGFGSAPNNVPAIPSVILTVAYVGTVP